MVDLIGQHISNYEIIGVLGKGGMAVVYRARQLNIQREVAIKVIKPDLADTNDLIKRFEREANTVASLTDPHILKLFDFGQYEGMLYLVMELMPGGTLADTARENPLTTEHAARLLDQIADALDYAHAQGLIHRDLKPQNILLDSQGNAHLTDFGIAKILGDTSTLTQSGVAMGTPAYMPPEQWQGLPLTRQADLYSLGVMLFEMLTGRLPFTANSSASMMYRHLQELPPSVHSIRGDLPAALDGFFTQALAKAPEQRFGSAGELRMAFKAAIRGQSVTTRPKRQVPREQTATDRVAVPDARADATDLPHATQTVQARRGLALGALVVMLLVGVLLLIRAVGTTRITAEVATATDAPINLVVITTASSLPTNTVQAATANSMPAIVLPTLTPSATQIPTLDLIMAAKATNAVEALTSIPQTATFSGGLTATASFWTPTSTVNPTLMATATVGPPTSTPTIRPTWDASSPVTSNRQWKPQFKDFDGVAMAVVPAGCFMMGDFEEGGKQCFDKPFWIDKTEVTQAQFRQFDGAKSSPSYFKGDQRPVDSISWFEARNFCAKRGARLPTEAEWEYSARGPDGLIWPWGNDYNDSRRVLITGAGFGSKPQGETANVGSLPNASWVGAVDMSGNIWEWVSSINKPYPYNKDDGRESTSDTSSIRVIRGSGHVGEAHAGDAIWRGGGFPTSQQVYMGFRCARS